MADTIAAVSTAPAAGGIGIVRISGENAREISDRIFSAVSGKKLVDAKGYTAHFGHIIKKGEELDEAIALVFASPKSYTGEDVVELSCHGGMFITRSVFRLAIENGARPAQAGEFTRRAFENGKITLDRAESVMNIISAKNDSAARAAYSVHSGRLYKELDEIKSEIVNISAWLAAWADFPEEDIPEVDPKVLLSRLKTQKGRIGKLIEGFDRGRLVCEGINTAIVGRPNVGKSTLMNLLCGNETSIVTSIAGTTRDVVNADVVVGDVLLRLSDTAGIRSTGDVVEKFGVERAKNALKSAELIIAVFDCTQSLNDDDMQLLEECQNRSCVAVINKSDLDSVIDIETVKKYIPNVTILSAKEPESLDRLSGAIIEVMDLAQFDSSGALLCNERQLDCATRSFNELDQAISALESGVTLDAISVCLDRSLDAIMELTGERVTNAVVDSVFHSFCVGK